MSKPAAKSLNTWDSVITAVVGLIATILTTQGIELSVSPDEIANAIQTKGGVSLALFILFKLYTPIVKVYKRVKDGGFEWAKLKSRNLISQVVSLLAVLAAIFIKDAEVVGMVTAVLVQVGNFAWHTIERNSSATAA